MTTTFLAVAVCLGTGAVAADAVTIASPDKAIEFKVVPSDGRLYYEITNKGYAVVEASPLAMSVDETEITHGVQAESPKRYEINDTYPWRGVHSRATNRCNGATLSLTHGPTNTRYTLDVRVFDDGVGFRFVIPGDERARVP